MKPRLAGMMTDMRSENCKSVTGGGAGRIELICGCMFSGKTEELLRRLSEARERGVTVAAFKHASDDRYATRQIVSHGGHRFDAIPVTDASAIPVMAGGAGLVAIDEAQFFGADLVEVCERLSAEGRSVVVAGLDRDSWGEPFGPMPGVEAIAAAVIKTRTTCSVCGQEATYTQRLAPVEGTCMIGGAESYEPRCKGCFQPPPLELRR